MKPVVFLGDSLWFGYVAFPRAHDGKPDIKRLGLTQPRLNDLLRGRITKFSLDALMKLATRAGLAVRVEIMRPAA